MARTAKQIAAQKKAAAASARARQRRTGTASAKHLGTTVAEMSGSKVKSKLPPPKISHRKGFLANQRRMQGFK